MYPNSQFFVNDQRSTLIVDLSPRTPLNWLHRFGNARH